MVTNHLRAPYDVYFTKNRTILRRPYGARPAAGRILRFFIIFLDIVRCPVKFRYYLKFHGARTAFGSLRVRCPDGARPAFSHIGRAPDDFYLIFISYDFNGARPGTVRRPSGHHTVPGRASYDVWQAPGNFKNRLTNRPMPVRAPDDARPGSGRCPSGLRPMCYESNCHRWEATCFCRRTYCIYIDISLLKTKKHKYKNIYFDWAAEDD